MNNINFSFLLSLLAGLSTLLGYFFIYINKNKDKTLISCLAFASGVMFLISLVDLLPHSIKILNKIFCLWPALLISIIGINIGILIAKYLNKTIDNDNKIYKVGLISMVAIIIHNIPEGIITFVTSFADRNLGITLAMAIMFHNIPEGISIAIPIYYATHKKFKAFIYTFISGMSELLGALIAYLFLDKLKSYLVMGSLLSVIAGLMLYISINELLVTSLQYKNIKRTISYFFIGVLFMLISHLFI